MVYGEACFIDEFDNIIGDYPTLAIESLTMNMFKEGCFICQPSVVFRRSMGVLLGSFDITLKTAFDFEYWMRAFSSFKDRIGFISKIQAYSRLHNETITSTQGQNVELEAMRILKKQFGYAPSHWFLTATEELLDTNSSDVNIDDLMNQAEALLNPNVYNQVSKKIRNMILSREKEIEGDWGSLNF